MPRCLSIVLLVLVPLGGWFAVGVATDTAKPPKDDDYELMKILVDTMDQVERNYVKEIDRRELVEAAIKGILTKLDPYSSYIGPDQISHFRTNVESEFGGIGIQVSMDGGQLRIISPLVGTPAYRAGLMAGDRIVEIEGISAAGISLDEAVRRLKGKAGTKVNLAVIHAGSNEKVEVTITRERIHVETILGDRRKQDDTWDFMYRPEQHIGYVRMTAFSRDTARELRKVIKQLQADKLQGLILDLRFNPGGLLGSAIEVSDLFVAKGRIVSTEGRNSPERSWDAKEKGTCEGFPMVVLVNRYSASASEIVSACLQDHKRAVIVGERTWGKSSVQNVIELEGGNSALKLTTASYLRPSGKNIHRFPDAKEKDEWGVMPDDGFLMRLGGAEMMQLIRDRRRRDVIRPKAEEPKPDAQEESDKPDEQPEESPDEQPGEEPEEKPAEETEEQPGEEPEEKPGEETEEKPAENDEANQEQPEGQQEPEDDDATEEPDENAGKDPEPPPFVDRQLQKAVEYLTGELARAE